MTGIIYKATNLFNGKIYIGQTRTTFEKRMSQHLKDAVYDSINSFHLALMQYGREGFSWEIVDKFSGSKEEVIHALNVAEEYHILKNRSLLDEYGYNATKGGYSSDKFADVIRKRALANYGSKAVLQYDLEGNFIQEFDSVAAASAFLGKNKRKGKDFIGRVCKGYQWRYKENNFFPKKISAIKCTVAQCPCLVYRQDGSFYKEYKSGNAAMRDGINARTREWGDSYLVKESTKWIVLKKVSEHFPKNIIVNIIKQEKKEIKGKEDSCVNGVPLLQYSSNGEFLREYNSIKEASRITGSAESTIRASLKVSDLVYYQRYLPKWIWRRKDGDIKEKIVVEIKEAQRKQTHKREHRILQYDRTGNFISIWPKEYQASLDSGDGMFLIRKSLRGESSNKMKFQWRKYEEDFPTIIPAV